MKQPKFENIRNYKNKVMKFTLAPYHVSYANTLRRIIISGVETVAMKADMTEKGTTTDITVYRNNTPMTNEMLADRVGLIPLAVSDPLTFDTDRYTFTINKTNNTMEPMDITADMIEVRETRANEDEPVLVETDRFFPPSPITGDYALIAVLRGKTGPVSQEEGIHLVGKASIGTGRQHARYIPVSQCSYEYTRDDDEARIEEFFREWLIRQKNYPNPDELASDSEKSAALRREFNTMAIARCFKVDEQNEPYSFDFTIESVGVLPVQNIMKRACEVTETICNRYSNIEEGELPEEVSITPSNNRMIGFDFLFRGHDHTLGNLLQTWLVDNHVAGDAEPKITYAGYSVPHPLRDEMVLRIGVDDGNEATARAAVQAAARGCAKFFEQTKQAWMQANGMDGPGAGPGAGAGAPKPRKV
jgi:DNA-directed RNA polymerase subunit L/DNA-directed RNA polymerase alpha subunit